MAKTILVPIDFSPAEPTIIACAASLAAALPAQIVLLHVEAPEPAFIGYEPGPQTVRDSVAQSIRGSSKALHAVRDRLRSEGLSVESLLIQGPTAEKIVDEARRLNADYIVLGSHGHSALFDLVVGSVSEGVIRRAPCPVVVVPRATQEAS